MKKSKWLILLLVFTMVFSLALAGCGKTPEEPQTGKEEPKQDEQQAPADTGGEKLAKEQVLRANLGEEPPDLDPQTTTDAVSFEILNATLEGLVRLNPDGSVGKGLAESWDVSDDGKVYTFKLRDAKWSDGDPITAYDFEYAWKRAIDPKTASQYAYQFYGIKNAKAFNTGEITDPNEIGVKALDEKTLKVELERPMSYFLSLTSFITYLPAKKAAVEKWGDKYAADADKMVFSGPFMITRWDHEQKLILEKNPNYWDADSVKLQRIEFDMIKDTNTPINLYETGELDMTGVPPEFLDKYKDSPEFGRMAEAVTFYLEFNCKDKFFSNKKIRKAFSLAIDREAYVNGVLANGSIPAYGFVPGGIPGKAGGEFRKQNGDLFYDAGTKGQEAIDEANKLLEEGLKEVGANKEELAKHVSYLTGDSDFARKLAQALQQMWKKNLGIEVPIESVSFKIRLQKMDQADFTIVGAGWGADYNDPMTFMDMWVTNGGNNDAFWSNAKYDELIEKAINSTGDERMEYMLEAEKLLMEEMPIAPTYFRARNFLQRPYVKGIARFPVGVDIEYKWAYILEH
ncbi:peptide ABC transporter substrate-binding protein [Caloranaerobacter azorensis]|uniref:Peptide ABC transporter substrate-binding protein n=1 Tax=Caloranaerobacter azorensis TaxID=116090 RepID=A0A6P1YEL9_9FIRM|nr:peptide ABC transporter substrate-binding protein [Caloranaerobacter azorensis]QIB27392.1 peptide ABC transporter substrate-binding protein [Caloranaerobacter azorensis]